MTNEGRGEIVKLLPSKKLFFPFSVYSVQQEDGSGQFSNFSSLSCFNRATKRLKKVLKFRFSPLYIDFWNEGKVSFEWLFNTAKFYFTINKIEITFLRILFYYVYRTLGIFIEWNFSSSFCNLNRSTNN